MVLEKGDLLQAVASSEGDRWGTRAATRQKESRLMIDSTKYQSQASELPQKLWAITKNLRGNMDSAKSRNYILGTIFYGRLSERTEDYMQEILKGDGLTHIQKTVDAYVKHIDEDKFAHVVT